MTNEHPTAPLWIRAAEPTAVTPINLAAASFVIEAATAPADGQKPKARAFTMTAYNGGAMRLSGFGNPVVVELSGIQDISKTRPIYMHHDPEQLVGHADKIAVDGTSLIASGVISGGGDHAQQVLDAHDNGFPWQASIGARVLNMEFVKDGSSATVNGRQFNGPINVVRKSVLGEISFVPLGADDSTSAQIAAQAAVGAPMTFEQWLKARGLTLDGLTDVQSSAYRSVFEAESKSNLLTAADGKTVTAAVEEDDKTTAKKVDDTVKAADVVADLRKSVAAESKRMGEIRRICAENKAPEITVEGKKVNLEAHAIEAGWDATKVELEAIRASRPTAPGAIVRDDTLNGQTIEAALYLAGGMGELPSLQAGQVKERPIHEVFPEKTLEAAQRRFRQGISLQELFLEAAWANGYTGRSFRNDVRGVLQSAMVQASGFSTFSLPGILSNVASKFLLKGFTNVENSWRLISTRRSVSDFKTITSYRLTGAMQFDEVGPTGEIKHGTLGETAFNNAAKTYAKMFAITRTDLINDDLGALTAVPQKLGRGSALKLNDVFWKTFLDNAALFTTGNKNYFSGAATNLQSSSLATAEQKFADQVDEDGKPIATMPAILLVPTALRRPALELMSSSAFIVGGGSDGTKIPLGNTWEGAYLVVVSAYLSNSSYTGNSSTAWYLLANPDDIPVIEVAFLNGQEQPTVESAEADFNTLGVQMRGYFDFGVAAQDFRGGVKSKGAA